MAGDTAGALRKCFGWIAKALDINAEKRAFNTRWHPLIIAIREMGLVPVVEFGRYDETGQRVGVIRIIQLTDNGRAVMLGPRDTGPSRIYDHAESQLSLIGSREGEFHNLIAIAVSPRYPDGKEFQGYVKGHTDALSIINKWHHDNFGLSGMEMLAYGSKDKKSGRPDFAPTLAVKRPH